MTTNIFSGKNNKMRSTAMAVTFIMGVFNDNFYKQVAMLLAVSADKSSLQGVAVILFILPFILCSAYTGWIAGRFEKRQVIIGAKWMELLVMLTGAAGIIYMNWPCILGMVALMGLKSTLFVPSLNAFVPQLFQAGNVPRINVHLKMLTTLPTLLGIACAGMVLDMKQPGMAYPFERIWVAMVILVVAAIGLVSAYGISGVKTLQIPGRFPWSGPIESIRDFHRCRKAPSLFRVLCCSTFIHFMVSVAILLLNTLGLSQFGWSWSATSFLVVSIMVGMCMGSFVAIPLLHNWKWSSSLPFSAFGMGGGLLLVAGMPLLSSDIVHWAMYGMMLLTGIFGGMFLIPVTSFIHLHSPTAEKGRIIGISNFLDFTGILIAGPIFWILDAYFLPSSSLGILGLVVLAGGVCLSVAEHKRWLVIRILAWGVHLRYRITLKNFDSIKKKGRKGILFLPNHPALMDPVLLMVTIGRRFVLRPLSDKNQVERPILEHIIPIFNPIVLPKLEVSGRQFHAQVKRAIREVNAALEKGDNVLFYPSGRLYRSKYEKLRGNSGVEQILKTHPDVQIVMVATHGLWGSSFSWGKGIRPHPFRLLPKYLISLLLNGIVFGPRRQVSIELNTADDFPRKADRHTINRYLEQFYNKDARSNTYVPYTWFEGHRPVIVAEPSRPPEEDLSVEVSPEVREMVQAYLTSLTGISHLNDDDRLARDLGLDSLTVVELMNWIETAFGVMLHDPERLVTVGSVLQAASGMLSGDEVVSLKPVASGWFNDLLTDTIRIPEGKTIPSVFLEQAARGLNRVVLADQIVGTKTFRDVISGIVALKSDIESLPGEKIGIMFPASASATIIILAVMFSGKIPVMVNWTAGESAMAWSLAHIGVTSVITSSELINRLKIQGLDFDKADASFLYIEDIVKKISLICKIRIFAISRLRWKHLRKAPIKKTAVILFTSGTEARPKAVPLSHNNILSNIRDCLSVFDLKENIRLISMLPPFHSFGFSIGSILPMVSGVKSVYHANPNEGATLAALIQTYRANLLFGTPTFVQGILRNAATEQMDSLSLIVTGAEKCPESVFRMVKKMCPDAVLCEGYGITECSPVVCVNHQDDYARGGIGFVLPSITYRIVHPETLAPIAYGRQGLLLLRGPSIFSGYLGEDVPSPFVRFENEDWYNTGDLVRENPKGYFHFSGRLKRFIKRGGEMISLNGIEAALENSFPDLISETSGFAICATDSEEEPEIMLFTTHDLSLEKINRAIREQGLSGLHFVRKVIRVSEIPLLGTGKTDYRSLKKPEE
jgi:acyl-CoA synthetase (AMP-forming)/AMP-acid ligase II/1-acyl-sn-glycerol-3-phosphate acyltransferase/acyl carrier protein